MSRQRVLVVDDDKDVVRLMRAYLEQAGYEVLVAYDGETAVHTIRRDMPDLVLLDLMLPRLDGWEITRIMRSDANLAAIPIIMLTARIEDTEKIVGLEMGADDYVTKPYNPREVVARVRARLRSSDAYQPQILKVGELEMDLGRREVQVNGRLVDLTPSEFSLLNVLLEQSGYVLTRSELVSKALGADFEGLERTLDSHIRNLRRKIEPDPKNPRYIQTIYGVGYRLEDKSW
ncbi:MAG: response regulator transcription factor [Chloroflexi bacterium]|nr:response regulator transcription factor [Chloroflexota bacterium]MBK6711827.1 response regulator transcription factor [Chloroflexota bacterium]MBK7180199.1 response regulator transcription factor [Chloroflexota bacterium]MBK7918450.1 response regulator transcription factor [Chloroflexota bacterium]MBK8931649.1 response regulator transcription factor [Chloroflexota bacterium]